MPSPACVSTNTAWPRAVSSRTAAGVMPTRYSWFLISLGTPMRMKSSLAGQADQRFFASSTDMKKSITNSTTAALVTIYGSITRFVAASKALAARYSNAVNNAGVASTKMTSNSRFRASIVHPSNKAIQNAPDSIDHFGDIGFGNDKGRRQRDGVAADADHEILFGEGKLDRVIAAPARGFRIGFEFDSRRQTDIADVGNEGRALQRMHGLFQHRLQLRGALEQSFVAIDVERCQRRGTRERMARVCVAVEQFDLVIRAAAHECVVDLAGYDRAANRHGAIRNALREGDDIRRHAIARGGKGVAQPSEAGDDFIEDQKDSMFVADRA